MSRPSARAGGDFRLVGRLLWEARPFRGRLLLLGLLHVLATPVALLVPLPLQVVVDHVLGGRPLTGPLAAVVPAAVAASPGSLLALATGAMVVFTLVLQAQVLLLWWLETWMGDHVTLGLRSRLLRHLQRLSFAHHDTKGPADAIYRVQSDASAIHHVLVTGLTPLLGSVLKVAVLLVAVARIDGALALVALATVPLLLLVIRLSRGPLRWHWSQVKERETEAMAVVQETLGALRVVRAFGREDREHDRWAARARAGVDAEVRAVLVEAGFWLLIGLVVATGAAAALWFGATHVLEGSLTLGALLMAMAYLSQAVEPLRAMGHRVSGLQRALASADRVFAVLDTAPDVVDLPGARPMGRARGRVTLEGVGFVPAGADRPVLSGVSVDVPAGSRVAVVGPSGSGKTTLLTLIARFQDVTSGSVRLDGRDVREVRLADLRRQFAVVPQEPTLFATSVRENVAYGRPDATFHDIVEATKAAGAHEFVQELPRGYDTVLGERGQRLSGGQRQRLAIARAFLADAPVLLLDEPTSQLDVASEAAVLGALERLSKARTTFVVAHRLSTVEGADLRLRVEGGSARLE